MIFSCLGKALEAQNPSPLLDVGQTIQLREQQISLLAILGLRKTCNQDGRFALPYIEASQPCRMLDTYISMANERSDTALTVELQPVLQLLLLQVQ